MKQPLLHWQKPDLVGKPEVEPLVACIRRSGQVVDSFIIRHGLPLLIALLISEDIVCLDKEVQDNVHADNGKKIFVTTLIARGIVFAIDVG